MIKNNSGIKPLWKNDVLIYIGDREFFNKKIMGNMFDAADSAIDRAIAEAVDGIIVDKGEEAFKESAWTLEIGTKVMFQGHYGSIFSRPSPTKKKEDNREYYRIIEDKKCNGLCIQNEQFESFI